MDTRLVLALRPAKPRAARRVRAVLCATLVCTALAGCAGTKSGPELSANSVSQSRKAALAEAQGLAVAHQQNPDDIPTAMRFASALQDIGSQNRAIDVLSEVADKHPNNQTAIAAYGKALAKAGRTQEAVTVLAKAESIGKPDWRILSARGTAYDNSGFHDKAREMYAKAAALAPEEPSILNNWGLSFALDQDLVAAEQMLARAASLPKADPKIRANLALVIGLQGRFDEAEEVAAMDLPPEAAQANAEYLREMLSKPDAWDLLRGSGSDDAA